MKACPPFLILLLLAGNGLFADTPVRGAKEIFYDPTNGAVVSVSRPNAFAPPPSSGHHGKTGAKHTAATRQNSQPAGTQEVHAPERRPVVVDTVNRTPTLGLSYWIELVGKDGAGQQVTDGRIFRSGERIRLHFRSNANGNIALLQIGSSGTSSVLFPDPTKGLGDSRLAAGEDRILPKDAAWFRFDSTRGTEKILVLFARNQQDLDIFSVRPSMDAIATREVLNRADAIRGGKDLVLETETENASEIGGYGVNLTGKPVVMEIQLKHQ